MPLDDFKLFKAEKLDGGLVTRVPAHSLLSHQSPDAQNFDPSEVGACKKRKGYVKFTSAAKVTPTGTFVSGLTAAATSAGTVYVLASEGTALHDITAGNWATTISGATITVDTLVRMFMFNDLFIICNQGGGPYKWNNTGNAAALGGSPPANARGGGVHRSRAFLYTGTSSVLSFSALSDPEDWTTADNAGSITINKGDGYVVNGFMSGGDFALVSKIAPSSGGKEGALYALFGSSPFDFNVKRISSVGAWGQEAMLQYDNMVFIATNRGVYAINGRNWARIDDPVFPTYDAIPNKGTIALGREGKKLRVSYPASGSANNRELIYDIERGVWGLNTGKTNRLYANHPDGRLLMGTSGTSILVWEDENGTSDDSAAINFYWKTPEFNFGNSAYNRRLYSAHFQVSNSNTATLTLDHLVNGSSQSWGQTMSTSTDFPVKRFATKSTPGKLHQLSITDNSTSGQTKLFGITAYSQQDQPIP